MTDADKDLVKAAPCDLVVPCGEPQTPLDPAPEVVRAVADEAVPAAGTTTGPPAWLEDFFSYATWKKLIRIARRVGARSHSEAVEAVNATLHDVGLHADRIEDPLRYARKALQHHVPRERQRFRRAEELATRGAGTPEMVDDPGLRVLEDAEWVLSVLRTLPPIQQKVMALYYDGYSVTEIAEDLGTPLTNVTSNLRLARAHLIKHEEVARLHRRTSPEGAADHQRRPGPGMEAGPEPPGHSAAGLDQATDATPSREE
jgi:DNA-directed RNA polymerase specialized sigma24 family protein